MTNVNLPSHWPLLDVDALYVNGWLEDCKEKKSMDTVKHVSVEDWERACIEAAKRAAFERDPRTKAARKAYKQARVRGMPEREAWANCSAELAKVRSSLDQRERDGEFNP